MAKVTFTIHKAGKHQRHSRRNQILDAAQRCFKKQGFHKTTLRDIAQEFGMSAGHIYNYFSNKEAIIEALVELRTQDEVIESRCMTIRAMLEGLRLAHIFTPEMDVPLVREMAIKRIKQIIALDEAEDQAAAAAEAKLKAEAMACAYYPVSEKPEA